MKKIIFSFTVCWLISISFNVNAEYQFDSEQQQVSFEHLTKRLRCVTCPNQSIADSQAPVAEAMRDQIIDMLKKGQTEVQIEDYFIERYGDYVRYQPRFKSNTILLWMGPFILLTIGGCILGAQLFRRNNQQ